MVLNHYREKDNWWQRQKSWWIPNKWSWLWSGEEGESIEEWGGGRRLPTGGVESPEALFRFKEAWRRLPVEEGGLHRSIEVEYLIQLLGLNRCVSWTDSEIKPQRQTHWWCSWILSQRMGKDAHQRLWNREVTWWKWCFREANVSAVCKVAQGRGGAEAVEHWGNRHTDSSRRWWGSSWEGGHGWEVKEKGHVRSIIRIN